MVFCLFFVLFFLLEYNRFIWAYSFGKKGDGCLLLLKALSWETDLWVTLGDFTVKNAKLKGNLHLTENRSTKYQFFSKLAQISHIYKHRNLISVEKMSNCFFPMNFMARSCKESTFSFLLLVHEPLMNYINSNVLAYMTFYINFDFFLRFKCVFIRMQ